MPQEQQLDQHRQRLIELRKVITEIEADPSKQEMAKRLEEVYGTVVQSAPAKKLTLKVTITVPEGLEERGREELLEYIRRLVIQDQHDELASLIQEAPGKSEDVADYIWEDYLETVDDLTDQQAA